MKRKNEKLFSLAFLAGLTLFTACSDDETTNNGGNGGDEPGTETTLTGTITEDVTLTSGNTYRLSGQYIVEEGATLTIEPGVQIVAVHDDIVDYILVKQGARINAEGTASSPIVMTSEQKQPGAWGGIHICGRAHTNVEGGTGSSEIGNATYGGNDDADNSGTLRYVRVEYTGYAFDEEHEANGISFYGVGSGTTVDHCQAYRGSDDGFEFFGGSVNISNMVVTDCSDDSFDWTEGWNGTATNLIATQESEETLGYACDCLIEADNNENNYGATPVSAPTIQNAILIGNGAAGNGVHLRRGTQVKMENVQIYGKGDALHVESAETENALMDGTSTMSNVKISGVVLSGEGTYTNEEFEADGNESNQVNPYSSYDDIIAENSWAAGWTQSWNESSNALADGSTLIGEISEDVTLGAGNTYYLSGQYIVHEGATLNIEEGVTLIAKYDEIVDYILIEQGAKINAVGTADAPIVMTSEREEAGAWGGIHICGRAHTNAQGGGYSEIGNAPYGGDVEDDNSGTLQYVRVEYTGYAFDEEHEANGISFYGVGNGTTVDHCQAYKGSDDGFEFFGGSVNVSNMVVVSCSDDSFDWTEGWNGTGTNLMAYQEAENSLGYACDCLIEADNNGDNNLAEPVAHPNLSNLLLVGNGADGRGVRLREGTQVTMDNARICGKTMPLTVETAPTENALLDGTSSLTNITISADFVSEEGIFTADNFLAGEGNSVDASLSFSSLADVIAACDWIEGSWVKAE